MCSEEENSEFMPTNPEMGLQSDGNYETNLARKLVIQESNNDVNVFEKDKEIREKDDPIKKYHTPAMETDIGERIIYEEKNEESLPGSKILQETLFDSKQTDEIMPNTMNEAATMKEKNIFRAETIKSGLKRNSSIRFEKTEHSPRRKKCLTIDTKQAIVPLAVNKEDSPNLFERKKTEQEKHPELLERIPFTSPLLLKSPTIGRKTTMKSPSNHAKRKMSRFGDVAESSEAIQMTKSDLKTDLNLPMFYHDFDIASEFCNYFSHNNKEKVIGKINMHESSQRKSNKKKKRIGTTTCIKLKGKDEALKLKIKK